MRFEELLHSLGRSEGAGSLAVEPIEETMCASCLTANFT